MAQACSSVTGLFSTAHIRDRYIFLSAMTVCVHTSSKLASLVRCVVLVTHYRKGAWLNVVVIIKLQREWKPYRIDNVMKNHKRQADNIYIRDCQQLQVDLCCKSLLLKRFFDLFLMNSLPFQRIRNRKQEKIEQLALGRLERSQTLRQNGWTRWTWTRAWPAVFPLHMRICSPAFVIVWAGCHIV